MNGPNIESARAQLLSPDQSHGIHVTSEAAKPQSAVNSLRDNQALANGQRQNATRPGIAAQPDASRVTTSRALSTAQRTIGGQTGDLRAQVPSDLRSSRAGVAPGAGSRRAEATNLSSKAAADAQTSKTEQDMRTHQTMQAGGAHAPACAGSGKQQQARIVPVKLDNNPANRGTQFNETRVAAQPTTRPSRSAERSPETTRETTEREHVHTPTEEPENRVVKNVSGSEAVHNPPALAT